MENDKDEEQRKRKRKVKLMIILAYLTIVFVIVMTALMMTCVIPSLKYGAWCNNDPFTTLNLNV